MDAITNAAYLWVANDPFLYGIAMDNEHEEDYAEEMINLMVDGAGAPDLLRDLLEYVDWYAIHKAVRDE